MTNYRQYKFYFVNLVVIEDQSLVYWWDDAFLKQYVEISKMGDETDVHLDLVAELREKEDKDDYGPLFEEEVDS